MKLHISLIPGYFRKCLLLLLMTLPVTGVFAEQAVTGRTGSDTPLPVLMIVIMLILLLVIALLSHVLRGAMDIYRDKMNKERSAAGSSTLLMIVFLVISPSLFANDTPAVIEATTATTFDMGGLTPLVFYLMWSIIALELLVIIVMIFQVKILLGLEKKKEIAVRTAKANPLKAIWTKLNSFKPVEKEAEIELSHNYDGIRELDNRLPPWWLYGFYVTIIFSVIYLWRFHVSHTAPSQEEEYVAAMQIADEQKKAYLAKAARQVDENNVTYLSAATDLQAGKGIYETNCTPCHGKSGEGIVGPNLTDDYWLHGGSMSDVFKSIKYGIPEKGMRSWSEDFSPVQLAQLSSFVKSIHGTNPPNAKEKQGELFQEKASDSTKAKPGLMAEK